MKRNTAGTVIKIALAFFLLSLFPIANAQDQKIPATKTVLSHDNEAFVGLWEAFKESKNGKLQIVLEIRENDDKTLYCLVSLRPKAPPDCRPKIFP